MKKAIVYSSGTGNTEKLAKVLQAEIGDVQYIGKPCDEALEADIIYVGSWTMAFSSTPDIKKFCEKFSNKKVFVFMTAGYGGSEEFLTPIINSAKESINSSNEIIGEYICQGKVSQQKCEAIKKMDMAKYEAMKAELENSVSHPNQDDITALIKAVQNSSK